MHLAARAGLRIWLRVLRIFWPGPWYGKSNIIASQRFYELFTAAGQRGLNCGWQRVHCRPPHMGCTGPLGAGRLKDDSDVCTTDSLDIVPLDIEMWTPATSASRLSATVPARWAKIKCLPQFNSGPANEIAASAARLEKMREAINDAVSETDVYARSKADGHRYGARKEPSIHCSMRLTWSAWVRCSFPMRSRWGLRYRAPRCGGTISAAADGLRSSARLASR